MKKLKLVCMTQADFSRTIWRLDVPANDKREVAKARSLDFSPSGMRAWDVIEVVCKSRRWMLHFVVTSVTKNRARVSVVSK